MKPRSGLAIILIAALSAGCAEAASAQPASSPVVEESLLGMRLFNQSCRVCHTKPQTTSPLYGPELSGNSAGGSADVLREVISNGTPRMPGFKHHFDPAQIDAIVAYIKSIPPVPSAPPGPSPPAR